MASYPRHNSPGTVIPTRRKANLSKIEWTINIKAESRECGSRRYEMTGGKVGTSFLVEKAYIAKQRVVAPRKIDVMYDIIYNAAARHAHR